MKIQLDKFLAITALIAGSAAAGQACSNNSSSSDGDGSDGSGGSGASGGSGNDSGGSTNEGGTGGELTTTGTGGGSEGGAAGDNADGSGGTGGNVAAGGAAGDTGEAGAPGEDFCEAPGPSAEACESLSFAGTLCDGDTRVTDAYLMCTNAASRYNANVLAAIMQCMEDIGGDPCDEVTHGAAAFACETEAIDEMDLCTTQTAADICSEIECSALEPGECEELLSRFPDGTLEGDPAATVLECFRTTEQSVGVDYPYCADILRGCLTE